jgi:nucleotide-binding universal stress UspA family protein
MQGTILVLLDGSETAERAVPLALALAARADARLRLVHVHLPVYELHARAAHADPYRYEFDTMDEAEIYMAGMLDRLRTSATGLATADIARGDVIETLLRNLARHDVGLVVMTTHGSGGPRGALMGGVAHAIVRDMRTPLIIAGPAVPGWGIARGDDGPILDIEVANIMVALDGTSPAECVLPEAIGLARAFGARLTLVTVVRETDPASNRAGTGTCDALAAREREMANYLDALSERLTNDGVPANRRLVRSDDTAGAILRAAGEEDADIIAMATHSSSRGAHPDLGVVPAAVMSSARMPVLLCRPDAVPGRAE